jgi:hypothetical protein
MYNFEVALGLASLKTAETLAYAKMILDGTNPYNEFNWFQDFDPSKLHDGEETDELKNYDAALALAAAGRMDEAYFVMKEVNIHKKLDPSDFRKLESSVAVRCVVDNMVEQYKNRAFKDGPKRKDEGTDKENKKRKIEYPEPADNYLILKDS